MRNKCPICGAELIHSDTFGYFKKFEETQTIFGDIFSCVNGKEKNGICESENFKVAGSFFTYHGSKGLNCGYPK